MSDKNSDTNSRISSYHQSKNNNIKKKRRKKYSYQEDDPYYPKQNVINEKEKENLNTNPEVETKIEDEYQGLMYYPKNNNDFDNMYYLKDEYSEYNNFKTKWKTEICRYWEMYGECKFGENCAFAHGDSELKKRKMTYNYKTKPCKQFFEIGYCSYGSRCQFSHKKEGLTKDNKNNNNEVSYLKIIKEFLSSENEISHELVKRPRLMTFEKITNSTLEESQNSKLKLYEDIINLKNSKIKLSDDTNYSNISNDNNNNKS